MGVLLLDPFGSLGSIGDGEGRGRRCGPRFREHWFVGLLLQPLIPCNHTPCSEGNVQPAVWGDILQAWQLGRRMSEGADRRRGVSSEPCLSSGSCA